MNVLVLYLFCLMLNTFKYYPVHITDKETEAEKGSLSSLRAQVKQELKRLSVSILIEFSFYETTFSSNLL